MREREWLYKDVKNYCPIVLIRKNDELFISNASLEECCPFTYDEELIDPNKFRRSCQTSCGKCCNKGYCGPWKPCEFVDFENIRQIPKEKLIVASNLNEKVCYEINWLKILEYIYQGYAFVNREYYFYYLDVPHENNEGKRICKLLTESGCLLSLEERPLNGATINKEMTMCQFLPKCSQNYDCWVNDKETMRILELIYLLQEAGEFNYYNNEDDINIKLAKIKEIQKIF